MQTPASLGYRWPAEWEPHRATWLSWPHNPDTWPGRLNFVFPVYAEMVRALSESELVCINVCDEAMEAQVRQFLSQNGVDLARVNFFRIPTNDAWARDHGPTFLVRDTEKGREHALADFAFNSWGEKYGPWDLDTQVPAKMAAALGLPRFEAGLVLEGGAIEGNGRGTILTTESCLLNPNRGAGRTHEQMERVLADFFGATNVLWLAEGIAADDTDGHIDDITRFVSPNCVVTVMAEDAQSDNYEILRENRRRLQSFRDEAGKPLDVIDLPMPPDLYIDDQRCPASYANFYIANRAVLVPIFGAKTDERALAILREAFTAREVIGIPCADLVFGLGAIHCVTQQEPA